MKKIILFASLLMAGVLLGCGGNDETNSNVSYNPFVDAFTSGKISRFSPVYVIFNQQIPGDKASSEELAKHIRINPHVAGEFSFEEPSTVVFKPTESFRRGTDYTMTVDVNYWFDTEKQNSRFSFPFSTYPLTFRANMESLTIKGDEGMMIVSTITTPDREDAETVKKLINFSEPVTVGWEHDADGRRHILTITELKRTDQKRKLDVSVSRNSHGAEQGTILSIDLPGKNEFLVYDAVYVSDPQKYIEVTFTEQLDEMQDLQGIAYIEEGSSDLVTIDANKLRLYPDDNTDGTLNIFLGGAIRSKSGLKLGEDMIRQVAVMSTKPSVRFVGNGTVIPRSEKLIVPFQAVNLRGVVVKVIRIYENNIGQFLQENKLDDSYGLVHVGRLLARKVIFLDQEDANLARWNTFALDLREYIEPEPGAIYRVELSYNWDLSVYPCEEASSKTREQLSAEEERKFKIELSNYDDGYYYYEYRSWYDYDYDDVDDPCTPSYYFYSDSKTSRNVMATDLGLIAKMGGDNRLTVLVHNIVSTLPEKGVEVVMYNYQQQAMGQAVTDTEGRAHINYNGGRPHYIVASQGTQRSYLRVDGGNALSMSTFDVSGEAVQKGIKGFIYGERGVWRPGDVIHLGFMLNDRTGSLPKDHPVTLELYNPLGQLVSTRTQTNNEMGLYTFDIPTEADAPTGAWHAKLRVGGVEFNKGLRVETVKPNRLKIDLEVPSKAVVRGRQFSMPLHTEWLQGAAARNLRYEIEASMSPTATRFDNYKAYTFDNNAKRYEQESFGLASGNTDAEGNAQVQAQLSAADDMSGMMNVNLTTRVFEESGDFSIDGSSFRYSPYEYYAGVKSPQKDRAQLDTGVGHIFDVVSVDYEGKPAAGRDLQVDVYKLEWYWWWSSDNGSLANYVSNSYNHPVKTMVVKTRQDGMGSFNLQFSNNDWGTYFIQVKDKDGGHEAGIMAYFDWPGMYGQREQEGVSAAEQLSITTDKKEYVQGEKMRIRFPSSEGSRAVVSIENGTGLVFVRDYICGAEETLVEVDVTQNMEPNVYVHVTLLQPYGNTINDLPIRLYGVVPVFVTSAGSHLYPAIATKDELRPMEDYEVIVSEKEGRPMAYTLAIVDEGLLDLTRFGTPDPWRAFNAREALGVSTWDMYNYVMGAYGGRIEQVFSIGGDDEAAPSSATKLNRFTPVVEFHGPFALKKGEKRRHTFKMPNYNGRVRVMVVAGDGTAYGSTDKSVVVRKPVMVLGTLPRVIGAGEEMSVPVTVFATQNGIGEVKVTVQCTGDMKVVGPATKELRFDEISDKQAVFRIAVGDRAGKGTVKFTATAKGETSVYETDIEIRSVRRPQTRVIAATVAPGQTWKQTVEMPGAAGTNSMKLELSSVQPVNLAKRLDFLLGYPHGCIEQITSKGFPQLYLSEFASLSASQEQIAQDAVKEVIRRMRSYQMTDGGFSYWPGGSDGYSWATAYATHFMLEAEGKGYLVPESQKKNALRYLAGQARNWKPESGYYSRSEELTQAYRLYVLALGGSAEVGAMNRLRENADLSLMSRWTLAAAYAKIGRSEVARSLATATKDMSAKGAQYDLTFGSTERDQALQLIAACLMDDAGTAGALAGEVSKLLGSDRWMSTQATSFCLIGMSEYMKKFETSGELAFNYNAGGKNDRIQTPKKVWSETVVENGAAAVNTEITNNGAATIFLNAVLTGTPNQGDEEAFANGVTIDVRYRDQKGSALNISSLEHGTNFTAEVIVRNPTAQPMTNLVLTQIFPSGWEILNTRFLNEGSSDSSGVGIDYQDYRDDRVFSYIDYLPSGREVKVVINLMAVYQGSFYLPPVYCEAMYNDRITANTEGARVEVK